jgi:hypothetical protein
MTPAKSVGTKFMKAGIKRTGIYRHLTNAIGGALCGVTGQMPAGIIRELDVKRKGRKYAHSPTRMDIGSLCRALEYLGLRP